MTVSWPPPANSYRWHSTASGTRWKWMLFRGSKGCLVAPGEITYRPQNLVPGSLPILYSKPTGEEIDEVRRARVLRVRVCLRYDEAVAVVAHRCRLRTHHRSVSVARVL